MALTDDIQAARAVSDAAVALRQDLRWNVKPSADRNRDIEGMLENVRLTMIPIRSAIGRLKWLDAEALKHEDALRDVSADLQYERKQLKKMLR